MTIHQAPGIPEKQRAWIEALKVELDIVLRKPDWNHAFDEWYLRLVPFQQRAVTILLATEVQRYRGRASTA